MGYDYYLLDDNRGLIPCSATEHAKWSDTHGSDTRQVGYTLINDNVRVTTWFDGINQNHPGEERPLVFRTEVMGGHFEVEPRWTSTWPEAKAEHDATVEEVKALLGTQ